MIFHGRYVGGSSGASAAPGPGAGDVNPNAIITKTYVNWDGSIPYAPIAANLTSTTGGGANRSIAAGLDGPFVDEYTGGVDVGLSRVLTIQFNYVAKIEVHRVPGLGQLVRAFGTRSVRRGESDREAGRLQRRPPRPTNAARWSRSG